MDFEETLRETRKGENRLPESKKTQKKKIFFCRSEGILANRIGSGPFWDQLALGDKAFT